MISKDVFNKTEPKLLQLANLWNAAESVEAKYDTLFKSNPHELAKLIGNATTYHDWQEFLSDSRVQDYIDRIHYTQAGIIVSKYLDPTIHVGVADTTKLNSAIKYRDDHKPNYAVPVQYVYMHTPMSQDEKEFLLDTPEHNKSGL